MFVKCLDCVIYTPEKRTSYSHEKVTAPSWHMIEDAIRRLDQERFPFVWLWASEDDREQEIDGYNEVLEIMGGDGVYWVAGTFGEYFQRRLDNPELGESRVEVCTGECSFGDAERYICRNVEVALQAARYYADHGDFDPSLRWSEGHAV